MADCRPQQKIYCPSDALHSKDLNTAFRNVVSPHDGGYDVVVCHRDKGSFYKSARKICRTADRICSALLWNLIEGVEIRAVGIRYDGYLIGSVDARSQKDGTSGDNRGDEAMRRRLESEFDGCKIDVEMDMPNISLDVFCGEGNSSDETWNVVFVDIDAIVAGHSSTGMQSASASQQVHHDSLQRTLSTMARHVKLGDNSIIHIKSGALYRVATSIGGSSKCVSGADVEKHRESANDCETSHITGTTIRRLQSKKGASGCPLSIYPPRYIEVPADDDENDNSVRTVEICRFHNYDAERGCLRSKRALRNADVVGCGLDHRHCHQCGGEDHRAFECIRADDALPGNLSSAVFRKTDDGDVVSVPRLVRGPSASATQVRSNLPSLLVVGGRLRGRTLATCEILPLSSTSSGTESRRQREWIPLPNLNEHRGSHAACSPVGTGLAFVLGGGTADGNSDAAEVLDVKSNDDGCDTRWRTMAGRLSSPRHAFEAVCVNKKLCDEEMMANNPALYAVGGWKYGSVSCEGVERLVFRHPAYEVPSEEFERHLLDDARWEQCAPLLLPRRLHSVAASADGSSIFVFGGYVDERRTTPSIEMYDVGLDEWHAVDELPHSENCPLVQAVAERGGFLIFPFSTERAEDKDAPKVLRYTPGSGEPFSLVLLSGHGEGNWRRQLRLPIANWHSFSATASTSLNKAFLVGGTIGGKWTNRSFELDLLTYEWTELPAMTFARRRLATLVLE